MKFEKFTEYSTVGDVIGDAAFKNFGRLLLVSSSQVYLWYSHIQEEKTLDILNTLKERALEGEQVFYPIYTQREMAADGTKRDTGLFFFRGKPGKEFAVMNAGGAFYYVGAMHDSFPHALEAGRQGYQAFALIYRPDSPYEDLARAIEWIWDHAGELQIKKEGYSLWGGSAGARMAAVLGNRTYLRQFTGRREISQAAAVVMQYTAYTSVSGREAPTYASVGSRDGIADWRVMRRRLEILDSMGIPTEFHVYEGLGHGFGLGTGTVAQGWIFDALRFWQKQIDDEK